MVILIKEKNLFKYKKQEPFEISCTKRRFVMKTLDYIALILVVIGAINWGLIGFFNFDLVKAIFGNMTLVSRIIYALVGVSGLYALSFFGRLRNE